MVRKPWQSLVLQRLIRERRNARTADERRTVSKDIQKEMRRELRKWHSTQAEKVLGEFKDLERLHGIHKAPILSMKRNEQPDPEIFASLLSQVYTSDLPNLEMNQILIQQIDLFSFRELLDGLRRMSNGRGMDSNGIVVEMVKDASDKFKQALLNVFNHILSTGSIEVDWHTILFSMLPKSGNLDDPTNWRPIAILPIFIRYFPVCCTID